MEIDDQTLYNQNEEKKEKDEPGSTAPDVNKKEKDDRSPVSGVVPDSEIKGSDADTNPDAEVVIPEQKKEERN